MSRAVSYSLFNYKADIENWADFATYVRGFLINVRINRILYPDWITVLNIDKASYESPYKPLFDWLTENTDTEISIREDNSPLCRAMLWRVQTAFEFDHPNWRYTHTLCRDTDSVGTYREAQAVEQWIQEDRAVHAITDSISHDIPLMGGMIGIRPGYVNDRLKITNNPSHVFDKLLVLNQDIRLNKKGSDQDLLNRAIFPLVQDSLTSHFILGMRHVVKEGNGMHYSIPDIQIDVDPIHKQLNDCAGHIGAAGFYEGPMIHWLNKLDPYRDSYIEIQKQFPRIAFWQA